MFDQRVKIRIIYKSGYVQEVTAKSMTVKRYPGGSKDIEWDSMDPKPLLLGVDEIAAIYEL